MVNFAPQRNARHTSGFPFPTLLSFLPLPLESVRTVGVRSYADVITKFSRIHRFPQFSLALGLRLAHADGSLLLLDPSAYASDLARKLWETLRRRSQNLAFWPSRCMLFNPTISFTSIVLNIYFIAKCCAPSKLQLKKRCL